MSSPSRATTAGRAYLDLQKQARVDHRPVQELFQLYILEAFLDRLSQSPHRDQLILKGGLLLAAFGERRPTRDVDLQAQALTNDAENVRQVIIQIAGIVIDDGVEFDLESARADLIRDEDLYTGVRVSLGAALLTARLPFHVDVNVGDPITPSPQPVSVSRLLGEEIVVLGYSISMVHAEKIVTAITHGTTNTRWRDFVDIYLLARRHPIDGETLTASIRSVASHRKTGLLGLAENARRFPPNGSAQNGLPGAASNNSKIELPNHSTICYRPSPSSQIPLSAAQPDTRSGIRAHARGKPQNQNSLRQRQDTFSHPRFHPRNTEYWAQLDDIWRTSERIRPAQKD